MTPQKPGQKFREVSQPRSCRGHSGECWVRTVEERDEVGEVHGAHEREVAGVGGQEQLLLVHHGCKTTILLLAKCPLIAC